MNETIDEPGGAEECKKVVPDVSQIPLSYLASHHDSVLDTAIRMVLEDLLNESDITAGFGNIP